MTEDATIPQVLADRVVRGSAAANMLTVGAASLFIAVAAQVALPIPFSPVPLTLQPLAVLLVGVTLGSTRGAAAVLLYLFEGATGLPVFAQSSAGAFWLFGATGGYLMSYPAAAWLAGWFSENGWGTTRLRAVSGMIVALAVIYAGGWAWLSTIAGPRAAFTMGVAPFVLADLVKVALGAALLPQLQKLVAKI
jgi:biotin transport system substrate-specific component